MHQAVKELLIKIEQEMKRQGCWNPAPPPVQRLSSCEPFCMDTLSFTEWLQWVYLARLTAIVDSHGSLPTGAQVRPYAEEALKAAGFESRRLLVLIRQLDECLK